MEPFLLFSLFVVLSEQIQKTWLLLLDPFLDLPFADTSSASLCGAWGESRGEILIELTNDAAAVDGLVCFGRVLLLPEDDTSSASY